MNTQNLRHKNNINYLFTASVIMLVVVLVMLITSNVEEHFLSTWLAMFFIACVPTQVLLGVWQDVNFPKKLPELKQPMQGILLICMSAFIGILMTVVIFYSVGGGISLPRPPMMHYLIVTVVFTFWYVIVWQLWPLNVESQPLLADKPPPFFRKRFQPYMMMLCLFIVAYGFGYIFFNTLFNFEFMLESAIYVPEIDPKGVFHAWYIISFMVTTVAVIFTLVLFDFWPVSYWIKPKQTFIWGSVNSVLILALSMVIYGFAINYCQLDPVIYLVHGPVSFIFGVFIPLNVFEGKLWKGSSPIKRGGMLCLVSIFSGFILNRLYFYLGSMIAEDSESGWPTYALELWVANAMLAFSFPIMVSITDQLKFWPLRREIEI